MDTKAHEWNSQDELITAKQPLSATRGVLSIRVD
jgi:hypothetical protein